MISKFKRLTNRGDTIVEVLLAIVVVSGTLGTAFATMDRGVQGTRASQERAEALKHVESQVELLKAAGEQNASIHGLGKSFCLSIAGSFINISDSLALSGVVDAQLENDDVDDYASPPSPCKVETIPGGYNLSITEDPADIFTVRARWENVSGRGKDQIEIKYRLRGSTP